MVNGIDFTQRGKKRQHSCGASSGGPRDTFSDLFIYNACNLVFITIHRPAVQYPDQSLRIIKEGREAVEITIFLLPFSSSRLLNLPFKSLLLSTGLRLDRRCGDRCVTFLSSSFTRFLLFVFRLGGGTEDFNNNVSTPSTPSWKQLKHLHLKVFLSACYESDKTTTSAPPAQALQLILYSI